MLILVRIGNTRPRTSLISR